MPALVLLSDVNDVILVVKGYNKIEYAYAFDIWTYTYMAEMFKLILDVFYPKMKYE